MQPSDFLGLDICRLKHAFEAGTNIFDLIMQETGDADLAVQVSYEIQAGSYIAAIEGPKNTPTFRASMRQFAILFEALGPRTILEAGIGEATTLANCLPLMSDQKKHLEWIGGFDVSLSRLLFAKKYCSTKLPENECAMFTGRLEQIPLADNSVDLVFTSHAMEPNFGKEEQILAELLRITRHWLVLREPSFDLGNEATRQHIRRCRYVDNIIGTVQAMGLDVLEHRLWGNDFNPVNQTAVTVIRKAEKQSHDKVEGSPKFINPVTRKLLSARHGFLYDSVGGVAFPIIEDVPCLLQEQAILCARMPNE